MINLITSFYISKFNSDLNNDRNFEIQSCLNNNLNNKNIEQVHLFVDDEEALNYLNKLDNNKINVISVGKKPLYSDLFEYANNLNNKICMVSNSDIYIHTCPTELINKLSSEELVYSLTRYEHDMSSPLIENYMGSHDCFIFKSPINPNILNKIKHVQHVWGSENVVLFEMQKLGIKILNPCYQIKTVHLHKSELREENRVRINNKKRNHIVPPNVIT